VYTTLLQPMLLAISTSDKHMQGAPRPGSLSKYAEENDVLNWRKHGRWAAPDKCSKMCEQK
jgi:hypothetical protein